MSTQATEKRPPDDFVVVSRIVAPCTTSGMDEKKSEKERRR